MVLQCIYGIMLFIEFGNIYYFFLTKEPFFQMYTCMLNYIFMWQILLAYYGKLFMVYDEICFFLKWKVIIQMWICSIICFMLQIMVTYIIYTPFLKILCNQFTYTFVYTHILFFLQPLPQGKLGADNSLCTECRCGGGNF